MFSTKFNFGVLLKKIVWYVNGCQRADKFVGIITDNLFLF